MCVDLHCIIQANMSVVHVGSSNLPYGSEIKGNYVFSLKSVEKPCFVIFGKLRFLLPYLVDH